MRGKYVDDLADALRYFIGARGEAGADDAIGVVGVGGVVAQPRDEVVCKEGVETGNEVLDGHVGHLLLWHGLIFALRHL